MIVVCAMEVTLIKIVLVCVMEILMLTIVVHVIMMLRMIVCKIVPANGAVMLR